MSDKPWSVGSVLIAAGIVSAGYGLVQAYRWDETGEPSRTWFVALLLGIPAVITGISLLIHGPANGWWFLIPTIFFLTFPAVMTTGHIGLWLASISAAVAAAFVVRHVTRSEPDKSASPERRAETFAE